MILSKIKKTGCVSMTAEEINEAIRKKAQELYELSGRKEGHDLENWTAAERIIRSQVCGQMPASGGLPVLVKEEMTRKVYVVSPDTSVKEAAQKMRDLNIGVLPVCDRDRIVGIVTDRDITVRASAQAKDPGSFKIRDVMTPQVEWCFDDDDVMDVARKMEKKQIRRLPVINHEKRLVGILSLGDMAVRGSSNIACEVLEKVSVPV